MTAENLFTTADRRKIIMLEYKISCMKAQRGRQERTIEELVVQLNHANAQVAELQLYLHEEKLTPMTTTQEQSND